MYKGLIKNVTFFKLYIYVIKIVFENWYVWTVFKSNKPLQL